MARGRDRRGKAGAKARGFLQRRLFFKEGMP